MTEIAHERRAPADGQKEQSTTEQAMQKVQETGGEVRQQMGEKAQELRAQAGEESAASSMIAPRMPARR